MPPKSVIKYGQKWCPRCEKDLDLGAFGNDKRSATGFRSMCKKCTVEDAEKWRADNPEKAAKTIRSAKLKTRGGCTIQQYEALLERQSGKCGICGGGPEPRDNFDVDHCHKTGKVRGLLCRSCNHGIGYLFEDEVAMQRAIDYVAGRALQSLVLPVDEDPILSVGRKYTIKYKYGIGPVEYTNMWKAQGGKCLICAKYCKTNPLLSVDHNHSTGEVRSLLCHLCNTGIGKFKEREISLERAITYLSNNRSTPTL